MPFETDLETDLNKLSPGFYQERFLHSQENTNPLDNNTINIIDTLECIYINFKEEHNDKITEIFELIDIETLVRPNLLKVSHSETNLIKEKFGTEFDTIDYEVLIKDIKLYLENNKTILDMQSTQDSIEMQYTSNNSIKQQPDLLRGINFSKPMSTKSTPVKELSELSDDSTKKFEKLEIEKDVLESMKFKGHKYGPLKHQEKMDWDKSIFMKAGDYRFCSLDTLDLESNLVGSNKIVEKNCYILYTCNKCIVLENESYDIMSLLDNFTDIKLIDRVDFTQFKEILHNRSFNSFDECETMYKTLKSTVPKESINILVENKVKSYINFRYIITDKINDRIKALELYNLCKKQITVDPKQFSKILLKLNLKKKRYQDGVYYYGLKPIDSNIKFNELRENLFEGLLPERLDPIKKDEHQQLLQDKLDERKKLKLPQKVVT